MMSLCSQVVMHTMLKTLVVCGSMLVASATAALAETPATKPAAPKPGLTLSADEMEAAANMAFNRGDYAIALPMLRKVAERYKDNPDKLGPVQEQIRVAAKQAAIDNLQKGAVSVDAPAPEARKPHPAPKDGQVQDMTIKELGNFEYDADKGGNIPDDIKKLAGSTVRLHGYMIPIDQAERISKFALVPSLFQCCFGQPPQMQHVIIITCPAGKAVSYFADELVVEGKLSVDEKKEDDIITSIFQVETSSVKPAAK